MTTLRVWLALTGVLELIFHLWLKYYEFDNLVLVFLRRSTRVYFITDVRFLYSCLLV
jgi:hypothetical protein